LPVNRLFDYCRGYRLAGAVPLAIVQNRMLPPKNSER